MTRGADQTWSRVTIFLTDVSEERSSISVCYILFVETQAFSRRIKVTLHKNFNPHGRSALKFVDCYRLSETQPIGKQMFAPREIERGTDHNLKAR